MINERTVERGSKKIKGGVKMKKLIVGLMVVGMLGVMAGMGEAAVTDDVKINLFITPVVITSLTVSPTYYYFGSVNVDSSTGSITALVLTNDGDIDVTIEKEMLADGDDWDITLSSSVENGFRLWAMVSDNQPDHTAFETGVSSFSKANLSTLNDLTDTTGTLVTMSKDETNNMWFRLDMPYAVSVTDEQKIMIRLMATSN